jgi:hypothetical protein
MEGVVNRSPTSVRPCRACLRSFPHICGQLTHAQAPYRLRQSSLPAIEDPLLLARGRSGNSPSSTLSPSSSRPPPSTSASARPTTRGVARRRLRRGRAGARGERRVTARGDESQVGQFVCVLAWVRVDRGRVRARAHVGREQPVAHGESAFSAAERVKRVPAKRTGDHGTSRVLECLRFARAACAHAAFRLLGVIEHVRRAPHRLLRAPARRTASAPALGPRAQLVRA